MCLWLYGFLSKKIKCLVPWGHTKRLLPQAASALPPPTRLQTAAWLITLPPLPSAHRRAYQAEGWWRTALCAAQSSFTLQLWTWDSAADLALHTSTFSRPPHTHLYPSGILPPLEMLFFTAEDSFKNHVEVEFYLSSAWFMTWWCVLLRALGLTCFAWEKACEMHCTKLSL